jgi:PAS domain S-box-containing protein
VHHTNPQASDKAITLALSLAQAERAIHKFTSGQIDAILEPDGRAFLLRPAQEHLRKREARLQTLFDSSADVITVVSRGGLILSQSRAAYRTLGYRPAQLVGKILFDFIHAEDLPRFHSAFFGVLEEFLPEALVEFRIRTNAGPYCKLEAAMSRLRAPTASNVVLICRDTARREAELVVPDLTDGQHLL